MPGVCEGEPCVAAVARSRSRHCYACYANTCGSLLFALLSLPSPAVKRPGRSAEQQESGFDVVFLESTRFTANTFDAVVGPDGNYFRAVVSKDQRDALLASAPEVVEALKGSQLQFAVKKRTDGGGACGHGATGYTLSNKALKSLGFRITKWKHIVPLPEDKDADKHEDAVAWIDIPVA